MQSHNYWNGKHVSPWHGECVWERTQNISLDGRIPVKETLTTERWGGKHLLYIVAKVFQKDENR